MNNKKILFLICGLMAFIGIMFITTGFILGGRLYSISFGSNGLNIKSQLSENKDKANMQTGNETLNQFNDMDIELEYADFKIIPSDHYGIEYCLDEHYQFTYQVENNKLIVKQKSKYSINGSLTFFSLGLHIPDEYVKIYIPQDIDLKNVSIKNESGNIEFESITCDELNIKDSYGDVKAGTIFCKTMNATLSSGDFEFDELSADSVMVKDDYGNFYGENLSGSDISVDMESGYVKLKNMTADNTMISSSYGNINIEKQNIKEKLEIEVESGKVNFEDVTANEFVADNAYGDIICSKTDIKSVDIKMESGDCDLGDITTQNLNIKSDYGNVTCNLLGKCSDYTYDLNTQYGSIEIDEKDMGDTCIALDSMKENKMVISCESGNIIIKQINN